MLVLLPPSEGKDAPDAGPPVELSSLAFGAALAERRAALLEALDPALREAPAAPAAEVYSGVLYGRLRLGELPAVTRERVLIFSALWGVVRPDDRIPHYRYSPKLRLDGIGAPAAWWREALAATLADEEDELLVDMRSGAYASFWKPRRATTLAVRAFRESGGGRQPVTHMVKAVRGEVARALLEAERPPADPEAAAALAERAGLTVELAEGGLEVIVD